MENCVVNQDRGARSLGRANYTMPNIETHLSRLAEVFTLSEQEGVKAYERLAVNDFDPNRLLDALIAKMRLENDAALAHELHVHEKIIVMLRQGKLSISISMLVFIHRITGIDIDELCDAMTNGRATSE